MDNDSDVIYYNIIITGQQNQSLTLARYQETRTVPILDDPSEYYMSVVRFSIDGSAIPIMVMPVITDPNDPTNVNYTPFTVTLQYEGIDYPRNLIFIPENNTRIPQPPSTGIGQDLSSMYYYVNSYETLVVMLNNAINESFSDIVAIHGGLEPTVQAPYFIFDRVQHKFSLVAQNVINPLVGGTNVYLTQFNGSNIPLYGSNQVNGTINIFLNDKLYSYFEAIDCYKIIGSPTTHLLIVRDLKNNYYYPPQNASNIAANQVVTSFLNANNSYTSQPEWFIITQQYDRISTWNSLSGIVFLTSTLPVQYEYIPASAINEQSQSGIAAFRPILTDFVPDLQIPGDARSRFNYYPQGPYRLISLTSSSALRRIDLQIFWQDQFQNLYPLYITYNEANTIKLMFIRKSLAKSSNMLTY